MNRLKYFIFYLMFLSLILSIFPIKAYSSTGNRRPHVVIINSYHYGHEWSDSIVNEIMDVYKEKLPNSNICIEYMDATRVSNPGYFKELYNIYKYKYGNQKIDVIISSDDSAFEFLLKYRDEIFPGTPVVFCGVNDFNEERLKGHSLFTGIAENADIKTNLEIALKLHPGTKNIAVITDKTSTNKALKNDLILNASGMKGSLNLTFIEDINIADVQKKVQALPGDSVIFLMSPIFKDSFGEFIPITEGARIISSASEIPVYSLWGFYMNNGIIGGMLTSGSVQGRQAAEMSIKLLKGAKLSSLPIINNKSSNTLIFDYNQLKYHGIKESLLPEGSTIINSPSRSYTINKRILWIIILAVMLILIIVIIILSINILQRRLVERTLMESEDRYRKLVDFLPYAIYVSHNGIIVFSNTAGLKLLGVRDYNEISGHKVMEYIKPESFNVNSEKMKSLLYNNNGLSLHEYTIIKRNGTEINVESSSISFPWDGQTALLIVARDITERKQAEELKRKLEENNILLRETMELDVLKTEFFTNISHELKTPLNVVLSSTQMLDAINKGNIKIQNNSKADEYINMMKQNCFRLIRLVDNLIDSTKIDSGYFQIYPKNLDIVSVVENITLSVAKYIEDKGINLIFDTEIEEKTISCDSEKIERILLNLLSNAAKFTNKGGSIMVNIYDKINSIIISVKDTGIGIPKDMQTSIFEKFVQVDKSLARNHFGSGLGLSIVKSLVEMHGGSIRLESELDIGTEFIIELPAAVHIEAGSTEDIASHSVQANCDRINIELSDIYN